MVALRRRWSTAGRTDALDAAAGAAAAMTGEQRGLSGWQYSIWMTELAATVEAYELGRVLNDTERDAVFRSVWSRIIRAGRKPERQPPVTTGLFRR